jgi:glycosyltransferase involved in cell wall biosynthesis
VKTLSWYYTSVLQERKTALAEALWYNAKPIVMHITLVTTYGFDPAFPSRPEQLQARGLAARGHHVLAYEYFDRRYAGQSRISDWLPGGIAVQRSHTLGFFAPQALLRMLHSERPAVLHIHHMRNLLAFQSVLLARRLGIPTVMTVHGLLHDGDLVVDRERPFAAPLRFDNLLLRPEQLRARLLRGAHPRRTVRNYCIHAPLLLVDRLIALSQHEANLLAQVGVAPERIVVLPNAVDLTPFEEQRIENREQRIENMVLFIGQLVPRKAFDVLARAMPAVVRACPAVRFVLVSHNRQGEGELLRLVEAGGVSKYVELRGRVSEEEKLALLSEAAVVAAPSRYEGFGIPLIEAMAAGCPLVTTDVAACNEIVQHERNGLLAAYDDPESLAAAIVRLLQDRELAQRLAAAGRRDAFALYSVERVVDGLEALYGSLGAG